MFEIKGIMTTAICYATVVEDEAAHYVPSGMSVWEGRKEQFARRNRELIAEILMDRAGLHGMDGFHTIHNYIDVEERILRKGAISAQKGELVLIPINMRDGSILACGKGNPDWNYSAPHGAGRVMSRSKARATLDLEAYRQSMEGVYTTSVNSGTLDEAPMAYKSLADIAGVIGDTVEIIDILKPIYNFKASEEVVGKRLR